MTLRQLGRWFAIGARVTGDADAARRGPEVLGRRLARRAVWRQIGRWTR